MYDIAEEKDQSKYLLILNKQLKDEASLESKRQDVSLAKYIRAAVFEKVRKDKAARAAK